ncbi:MAG: hypothetical protein ACRELA_11710 [Candidatus Rokuibacteriota bacterium]
MDKDDEIRDLMAKLMRAVEASLSTSTAVREALAELVRSGYEARLFFVANAEVPGEKDSDGEDDEASVEEEEASLVREIGAVPDAGDLRFELTKLDYDFLKSLHIRPENE